MAATKTTKSSGQTKRSSSSGTKSRNGSGSAGAAKRAAASTKGKAKSSSSRNGSGTKAKPASKRNSTKTNAPKSRAKTSVPKRPTQETPVEKAEAIKDDVVSGASDAASAVKDAGGKTADFTSNAKGPLLAGGAAVAGLIGGVMLLGRRAKGPTLPLPRGGKLDLGRLSLDSATKAGRRVGALGQQVGDIAAAVEAARKKS